MEEHEYALLSPDDLLRVMKEGHRAALEFFERRIHIYAAHVRRIDGSIHKSYDDLQEVLAKARVHVYRKLDVHYADEVGRLDSWIMQKITWLCRDAHRPSGKSVPTVELSENDGAETMDADLQPPVGEGDFSSLQEARYALLRSRHWPQIKRALGPAATETVLYHFEHPELTHEQLATLFKVEARTIQNHLSKYNGVCARYLNRLDSE